MISSARGFGAPERVPAGKVARKTSIGRGVVAQVALDRRDQVHDVAEALDLHELGDLDRSGDAHLREVVAREIDEHEVLGALFASPSSSSARSTSCSGRLAARFRPGDRMRVPAAVGHLDERLGRRPDDPVRARRRPSSSGEQVHVGLGLSVRSTR